MFSSVFAAYTCANCGSKFRSFRLYCTECGCVMPQALTGSTEVTKLLPNNQASPVDVVWGRTFFHPKAHLFFRKDTTGESFQVSLEGPPVFIGRDVTRPAIVFRAVEAEEAGISRVHARLD